ncbi:MAG TPA: hypothetical protein VHI13_04515 [Candidatus Kapabacteria bacterium]|nr:hypothetical protein [Candidatus Kapabacteria bacterium]
MKRAIFAVIGAGIMLTAARGIAHADIQYWYVVGRDGCSEYLYEYNEQYRSWSVMYHCCGSSYWCYDDQGIADPCGNGQTLPTFNNGTPVVYDSAGNQIVSVAPGRGGHIGSESGVCRSFIPDGSSTLVIPPWGLQ